LLLLLFLGNGIVAASSSHDHYNNNNDDQDEDNTDNGNDDDGPKWEATTVLVLLTVSVNILGSVTTAAVVLLEVRLAVLRNARVCVECVSRGNEVIAKVVLAAVV